MIFGRAEPADWHDRPLAIVGCGPSLQTFDLNRIRDTGARVLAVKGAIFDLPWAYMGFGLDWPRFKQWRDRLAEATMPIVWAFEPDVSISLPANVMAIKRKNGTNALSTDPAALTCGGTSGFAALNLAFLKGAKQIVLFGYDHTAKGAQWHANWKHYAGHRNHSRRNWGTWAENYEATLPLLRQNGVEVANASPESLIGAFPRCSLEDGLAFLRS